MINLLVDEAYAFDFISVLDIKKNNSSKDQENFDITCDYIRSQVGHELFDLIINSQIYNEMIEANKVIYDLIDDIRVRHIIMDAKIVDDANNQRFFLKKKLQENFFNDNLTESKTNI